MSRLLPTVMATALALASPSFGQSVSNDRCEDAEVVDLTSLPIEVIGSTAGAADDESPSCANGFGGRDVFFTFTLEEPTDLRIDTTGSSFDTVLSLRGGDCADPVEIDCNDDFQGISSRLDLQQLPAGSYTLLLEGFDPGQEGAYVVRFETPSAPMNDTCAQAAAMTLGRTIGSTVGASDTPGMRIPDLPSEGPDVFHRFTASSQQMRVDSLGSRFDTTLAVYSGCGETLIASNDDFGGTLQSSIDLTGLTMGAEYIIQVDAPPGVSGIYELQLLETQPPPSNNLCNSSAPFTSVPSTIAGNTNFAENLSAPTEGGTGPEVFYRVLVPEGGNLIVETEGSSFDTVVYVRRGSCAGPQVGFNDDFQGLRSSRLVLPNLSGDDYFVFVDSKLPAHRGPFQLRLTSTLAPPNDTCETAMSITLPGTFSGSTEFASDSRNVNLAGCQSVGGEVVFEFELATERRVGFNTLGSNFDTVLYLTEGGCGAETVLACNDDAVGLLSVLDDFEEDPLPAGSYRIYVDGNLESGNFVLNAFYIGDEPTPTPTPTGTLIETPTETPTNSPIPSLGPPDANGDLRVDVFDLLLLAGQRRTGEIPAEESADFDMSGAIDHLDFFYFSAFWFEGVE